MADPLEELDLASTGFFLTEAPGFSHAVATLVLLGGRPDVAGLASATDAAMASMPRFRSKVVDRGGPIQHRWMWLADPDHAPTRVVDLDRCEPAAGLAGVVDAVYDRGRRARDLRREHPVRCTVGTLSEELTVLAVERHHAAADAVTTYRFVRDVLAGYHRLVTGTSPRWAAAPVTHAAASVETRTAGSPAAVARAVGRQLRSRAETRDVTQIAGTGGADPRQLLGRAEVADPADIAALRRRSRALGASLTDLVVAATMRAVGSWNTARGARVGTQRHAIPVAQPSQGSTRGGNELSIVKVTCGPDELDDVESLVRSVTAQRRAVTDEGVDVALSGLTRAMSPLRFVPPSPRVAERAQRTSDTVVVTNPGFLWPEIVDGRPTGATALDSAAGLELLDTLSVFNGGPSGTLRVSTLHRTLRLDMARSAAHSTPDEVDGFAATVRSELLGLL